MYIALKNVCLSLHSLSRGPGQIALTVIPFSAVSTATAYKSKINNLIHNLMRSFKEKRFKLWVHVPNL